MHRESGTNYAVDPIVKLIWPKVGITKAITISITKTIVTKTGARMNKSSDSTSDNPICLNESVINSWFLAILSTIHFC